MVQLFGRITKDATVRELKDQRKVVNFSIALNDSYKRNGGEVVKQVTFVNCSYWINPANAAFLVKGKLIEINGRLSVGAFVNLKGEAVATFNFHINNFKLYGGGGSVDQRKQSGERRAKRPHTKNAAEIPPSVDDLPF